MDLLDRESEPTVRLNPATLKPFVLSAPEVQTLINDKQLSAVRYTNAGFEPPTIGSTLRISEICRTFKCTVYSYNRLKKRLAPTGKASGYNYAADNWFLTLRGHIDLRPGTPIFSILTPMEELERQVLKRHAENQDQDALHSNPFDMDDSEEVKVVAGLSCGRWCTASKMPVESTRLIVRLDEVYGVHLVSNASMYKLTLIEHITDRLIG